jgi:phosphate acetyltransferase
VDVIEMLAAKAKENTRTIVFPEGADPVIQEAAKKLAADGLVKPVLLGDPDSLQKDLQVEASFLDVINPAASSLTGDYVERYCQERDMPESVGKRVMSQPLCFAAMMVKTGQAHGMVAGIAHPTEEVIMASELIIGLEHGISLVSSFFLMEVPGFRGGQDGLLVFSDPAVNPNPDSSQLADIALSTARSARDLLGWEPKVAMLSFSTLGSAGHPMVDKVIEATSLARERDPGLLIEGEIQADAALIAAVAKKKVNAKSAVAGQANVLIFPDLNAANISAKLVQRLAGAISYGPVLQGFALPVSDLSRGASVDDVVGAALMVAARDSS